MSLTEEIRHSEGSKSSSKDSQSLYSELTLYSTPDKYFLVPVGEPGSTLVVDRMCGTLTREDAQESDLRARSESFMVIYGVLGSIRLLSGPYLVVVTQREKIGTISGQDVYKMSGTQLLPYTRTTTHLTEAQVKLNKEYKAMVESCLGTPSCYFSYTYDLTHSLQRLYNITPDFFKVALHLRADQRFVWNHHLLKTFEMEPVTAGFLLPVMMGFVSINSCVLNGKSFQYILISRRSRHRPGTRLFTRGIDDLGNVANFVETEQLIECKADRASFVQTRGSIPFFWQQWPNLKYKPSPKVIPGLNHQEAFLRHFDSQILEYGRQVIVNLVNQTGSEGKLEKVYKDLCSECGNSSVRYEAFDFHAECAKMRWDRLRILIDRLAHDLDQMGVMMILNETTVVSEQTGVFRTNCIDCLDRTNVVQSMLARASLNHVLSRLGILRPGQGVESTGLESLFKAVWADNADFISTQYSGTGALKTDFTRTGKRSWQGVMNDGLNSMTRYFKNNFTDGFRQDGIELFMGGHRISPGEGVTVKSPLEASKGWKTTILPIIFLIALAMFFANLIGFPTDQNEGWSPWALVSQLFWGTMMVVSSVTILRYGTEFVDAPRLSTKRPRPPIPQP